MEQTYIPGSLYFDEFVFRGGVFVGIRVVFPGELMVAKEWSVVRELIMYILAPNVERDGETRERVWRAVGKDRKENIGIPRNIVSLSRKQKRPSRLLIPCKGFCWTHLAGR